MKLNGRRTERMSSRRRNSKKNLGNSISDIQRRIRRMERKPIRTRLQRRVIKGSAIAPSTITAEEVSFGITAITSDNPADVIDNPKDGLLVVDPDTNSAYVYSDFERDYIEIKDTTTLSIAQGKSRTYVQNDEPTGGTYALGDLWIDTNDGNKLYVYSGSAWVVRQDTAISTAQSTANGKNTIHYSTSDPGSTANIAGDIWWKYASGIVIKQYVGAGGTTWNESTVGNAVIANLDAGKITAGYLDVSGSVKITTDKTKSGNQSRVEINSDGFYAYDGDVATVSITKSGVAAFSGAIYATSGNFSGTITASGTISGGTISGATVIGGIFRTAAVNSTRVEINSTTSVGLIKFYVNAGADPVGQVGVQSGGLALIGPASNSLAFTSDRGAALLTTAEGGGTLHELTFSPNGGAKLGALQNSITFSNADTRVYLGSSSLPGSLALRNIQALLVGTATSQGVSSDGAVTAGYGWTVGDIVLTY